MKHEPLLRDGYLALKECRHGRFLYNVNDAYVGRSLDRYGEFSESEFALLENFASGVVLDVGANIGALTIPLAKRAKRVIAFEPQRVAADMLTANVALNRLMNVDVLRACLLDEDKVVRIPEVNPNIPANFGGIGLDGPPPGTPPEETEAREVTCLPFDRLRQKFIGDDTLTLVKLDVEGREREVLVGMRETIMRYRPVISLEDDRPHRSQALQLLLRSMDYTLYEHRPYLYSATNYFGEAENVFPNIVSMNLLAVPTERPLSFPPENYELRKV